MSSLTTINSFNTEDTKRAKFLRLSNARLKEALEQIRLIKNCFSNPYAYQYDYRDVEHIVDTLEKAIGQLKHYQRMKLDTDKVKAYLTN